MLRGQGSEQGAWQHIMSMKVHKMEVQKVQGCVRDCGHACVCVHVPAASSIRELSSSSRHIRFSIISQGNLIGTKS